MKNLFLKKYIDELTKDDISSFAIINNITLTDNELSIIYNTIKSYWYTIIFDDYKLILNKISNNISDKNIKKIEELIIFYKNKYKTYL
ncbi:MAG: hypothetical protein PHN42_05475 [Bacilli bacterium]|nr:hypothetical protein [Bacilli bacterium]